MSCRCRRYFYGGPRRPLLRGRERSCARRRRGGRSPSCCRTGRAGGGAARFPQAVEPAPGSGGMNEDERGGQPAQRHGRKEAEGDLVAHTVWRPAPPRDPRYDDDEQDAQLDGRHGLHSPPSEVGTTATARSVPAREGVPPATRSDRPRALASRSWPQAPTWTQLQLRRARDPRGPDYRHGCPDPPGRGRGTRLRATATRSAGFRPDDVGDIAVSVT